MTGWERRMVLDTWRCMLPLPEGVPWPEGHARGFLEAFDREAPWLGRLLFRGAAWLVHLAPVLRGRPRTLSSLPTDQAAALLERLYASPVYLVRQAVLLLRLQGSMAVLGDLGVQAALGLRERPWRPRGERLPPTRAEELAAHGIAPERGGVEAP